MLEQSERLDRAVLEGAKEPCDDALARTSHLEHGHPPGDTGPKNDRSKVIILRSGLCSRVIDLRQFPKAGTGCILCVYLLSGQKYVVFAQPSTRLPEGDLDGAGAFYLTHPSFLSSPFDGFPSSHNKTC